MSRPVCTASVKVFHISSHPSSGANIMSQSMWFKNLPIDALELARRSRFVMVFLVLLMRFPCSGVATTTLWSDNPNGANGCGGEWYSCMFIWKRSRVASFRVCTFTICLRRKCLNRPLISKWLKSPVARIPQLGYLDSTRVRDWNKCSRIDLSSDFGGWWITAAIMQENPWGRRVVFKWSHKLSCSSQQLKGGGGSEGVCIP